MPLSAFLWICELVLTQACDNTNPVYVCSPCVIAPRKIAELQSSRDSPTRGLTPDLRENRTLNALWICKVFLRGTFKCGRTIRSGFSLAPGHAAIRGRHWGTGLFHMLIRGGSSDLTPITHTHWDPCESCSTLCNAHDSFSPGSSVFSSMMSVKGQKIHNALQHLCGGRKLDGIG